MANDVVLCLLKKKKNVLQYESLIYVRKINFRIEKVRGLKSILMSRIFNGKNSKENEKRASSRVQMETKAENRPNKNTKSVPFLLSHVKTARLT